MTRTRFVSALFYLPLFAGCATHYTHYSEAPLATNFPTNKQPKLQAAAHWNVIAGDVAKQISTGLKDKRPLFVNQSSVKTAFERAFTNDLISALVADGYTVLKSPAGALSVDVDTQAVRFSANRPQYNHAGRATALTTDVWALHQAEATATADAYSWFRSEFATGKTPRTEIIVTTSVTDVSQYFVRSTSVYYVADSDQMLYQATPLTTRTIPLTGGQ
jgi:hypothetical protein